MRYLLLFSILIASLTSYCQGSLVCPSDTVVNANVFALTDSDRQNDSIVYAHEKTDFPTDYGFPESANYTAVKLLDACSGDLKASPPTGVSNVVACIERSFVRTSDNATCTQNIWLITDIVFTEDNIVWPQDLTLSWKEYRKKKVRDQQDWGAYIVISDSTMVEWIQELKDSFPEMNVQVYGNKKEQRARIRHLEKIHNSKPKAPTYHSFTADDLDSKTMRELGIESVYIEPVIGDTPYSLIGITYDDTIFFAGDSKDILRPTKMIRRWSVIDWCGYNCKDNSGIWDHEQIITFEK